MATQIPPSPAAAEALHRLHARFDGVIPDAAREAVQGGGARRLAWLGATAQAALFDRLARGVVAALAAGRSCFVAADLAAADRGPADPAPADRATPDPAPPAGAPSRLAALAHDLAWYRARGLAWLDALRRCQP